MKIKILCGFIEGEEGRGDPLAIVTPGLWVGGHSVPPILDLDVLGGTEVARGGLDLGLEVGDSPGEGSVGCEGEGK